MSDRYTKYEGHTPGPWSYYEDSCAECRRTGTAEYCIVEPDGGDHGQFSNEADARLIADAPTLLAENKRLREALEKYGRHTGTCNSHGGKDCNCGWDRARAALQGDTP